MPIKITVGYHFPPIRMATKRKTNITRFGEALEQMEPSHSPGSNVNGTAALENTSAVPQKAQLELGHLRGSVS